jgi:hypothetical protein
MRYCGSLGMVPFMVYPLIRKAIFRLIYQFVLVEVI